MLFKRTKRHPATGNGRQPFEVVASVQSDRGCVREANEDTGRFFRPSDPALLARRGILTIVADGMGGHLGGEVASKLAVETIGRVYYQARDSAAAALKEAFEEASQRIYEASLQDENLQGMGTTCTALALLDNLALAAHVGDSRLYLRRESEVYLMTEDHSAVMEMVRQGVISQQEARHHADKNVILRALGTGPQVEVSIWEKPLTVRAGDQFILCSDGLYDMVEDAEINQVLSAADDPHAACEQLIALAKERGGHDNITVGVISINHAGRENSRRPRTTRELEAAE
ncbi:MAG TPA: Stp1/IreP family PP2C-type Ser/Thr phosphatase [Pyrinomonadaceae bacterium]|jgi:protein phosphatase